VAVVSRRLHQHDFVFGGSAAAAVAARFLSRAIVHAGTEMAYPAEKNIDLIR